MIRRLLSLVAVAAVATPPLAFAAPNAAAQGALVAICHIEGHAHDFVTNGGGTGCVRGTSLTPPGGNILIVSQWSCENGHGAGGSVVSGVDCDFDNVDLLIPACLQGNPAGC